MYFRGLTFSLIFHSFLILFAMGLQISNFFNSASKNAAYTFNTDKLIKLELGAVYYPELVNDTSQFSKDAYNTYSSHGSDRFNYGRIISNTLLEKLNAVNMRVEDNKVKLVLTISKSGKLLDFSLHFQNADSNLQQILESVLNSGIKFPPNKTSRKPSAKYQILLF